MLFKMPGIHDLEIECSDPDLVVGIDERVKGVTYRVKWGDERLPIIYLTRCSAYSAAFGAHWAANLMQEAALKKLIGEKCDS